MLVFNLIVNDHMSISIYCTLLVKGSQQSMVQVLGQRQNDIIIYNLVGQRHYYII